MISANPNDYMLTIQVINGIINRKTDIPNKLLNIRDFKDIFDATNGIISDIKLKEIIGGINK